MKKYILLTVIMIFISVSVLKAYNRALWVWRTTDIIQSDTAKNKFFQVCLKKFINHIYLYTAESYFTTYKSELRSFITLAHIYNMEVYGLDGYRGYLSDASPGHSGIINMVNALISYNSSVSVNERFDGLCSDIEPQDQAGFPDNFHNGKKDSSLNTSPGSGHNGRSEKEDRIWLLADWLSVHNQIKSLLSSANLKLSVALAAHYDSYYGETVMVTNNGASVPFYKAAIDIVDEVALMTYRVNAIDEISRSLDEVIYADSKNKKIYTGIETNPGAGATVSVADAGLTCSGLETFIYDVEEGFHTYPVFQGVALHSYRGYTNYASCDAMTYSSSSSGEDNSGNSPSITINNRTFNINNDNGEAVFIFDKTYKYMLKIFSTDGLKVYEQTGSGTSCSWNGKDINDRFVEAGAYVYILVTSDTRKQGIIIVAK